MRVNTVRSLEQARQNHADELQIALREETVNADLVEKIYQVLEHAGEGQCPVSFWYSQPENRARITAGEKWRVVPSDELIQQLEDCCGNDSVRLSYPV